MWWNHRECMLRPGWSGDGCGRMERHLGYKEGEPGEGGEKLRKQQAQNQENKRALWHVQGAIHRGSLEWRRR